MRRGLVGDAVRHHAALDQLREHLGGVAEQPDGRGMTRSAGSVDRRQRLVQRGRPLVQVSGAPAELDAGVVALDGEAAEPGHHRRQRLGATHPAEPAGEDPAATGVTAEVLGGHRLERLVGALHDALGADVDPAPGRHLAVHHQTGAIELVEVLPGRPVRHQVGVGDQHPWGVGVGLEHADRLPGLHQQGLVVLEALEGLEDGIEALPVARRATAPPVHDELVRVLGDVGIEVVLDHPERRFCQPALAGQLAAARGLDHTVAAAGRHLESSLVRSPATTRP